MTSEMQAQLDAMFPGDIVDAPPPQVFGRGWVSSHPIERYAEPEKPVVASHAFRRLVARPTPPASLYIPTPSVGKTPYLLEPVNRALWLREARELAGDLRLGLEVSYPHITRLVLDAKAFFAHTGR